MPLEILFRYSPEDAREPGWNVSFLLLVAGFQ